MTTELIHHDTGEAISHAAVRDSIAVARSHGEKFFEQIVWQVENEVWTILGYQSWDAMREAEYADMGVVAPRADRPELASRLAARGLPNTAIAETLGVSEGTIRNLNRNSTNEDRPTMVTNSRGQQRPASYQRREPEVDHGEWKSPSELLAEGLPAPSPTGAPKDEPPKPRQKPLTDSFREGTYDLGKRLASLHRLTDDARFPRNAQKVAEANLHDLLRTRDLLEQVIEQLETNYPKDT